MSTNIATMSVRLLADTRRFSSGMLKAQTEMGFTIRNAGRLSEKMSKVGWTAGVAARGFHIASGALRAVGIASAVAGAAVIGFGAKSSKVARDFEDQFLKVKAITQQTSAEMAKMQSGTFQKAVNMGISPTKMMTGNVEAARTGLSGKEVSAIEKGVAQLATVEMVDFAKAAEYGTDIMKAFGIESQIVGPQVEGSAAGMASAFEHTANILATTSATSNTNLDRLWAGLKKVAATASASKVPLEQAAAAMGMLGNVGFVGEEAGTAIRNILTRSYADTSKVKDIIKETGMELAKAGQSNTLLQNLKEMEKINLSPQNIFEIYGLRAGPAMIALLEQGSEKLEIYQTFLEEAGGMQAMFNDMQGATSVAIGRVMAIVEIAGIMIGSVLNVAVREASARFVEWVGPIDVAMQSLKDMTSKGMLYALRGLGRFLKSIPPVLQGLGMFIDALRLVGRTLRFVFEMAVPLASRAFTAMLLMTEAIATALTGFFRALAAKITANVGLMSTLADSTIPLADRLKAVKDFFTGENGNAFEESMKETFSNTTTLVKKSLHEWATGLEEFVVIAEEFGNDLSRDKLLKMTTFFEGVGEGFDFAGAEVLDFADKVEEALGNISNAADPEYLAALKKFQEDFAAAKKKWDGGTHVTHDKDGDKKKKNLEKQLGYLNKYRLLAARIVAKQDVGLLKEKAALEYMATREDIYRSNLSVADQEFRLGIEEEKLKLRMLAIDDEALRIAIEAKNTKEETLEAAYDEFALKQKAAQANMLGGLTAGLGVIGGAGAADSLSAELAERQAGVDRDALTGWELANAKITLQNQLIIEQISLYEQLADTIGSEVPSIITSMSAVTSENILMKEGTEAIVGTMQSLSAIGSSVFAAMGMSAKQQRHAQMALNFTMAAFATGMALVAAFTPGMQAQAPGYAAAAVAFASKGVMGAASGRGLNVTKKAPEKAEESQSNVVKRGVVDALKEAGIYQPWERLTLNTFGTTPVDYGGSGNLPGARAVTYHNQNNSRGRG